MESRPGEAIGAARAGLAAQLTLAILEGAAGARRAELGALGGGEGPLGARRGRIRANGT